VLAGPAEDEIDVAKHVADGFHRRLLHLSRENASGLTARDRSRVKPNTLATSNSQYDGIACGCAAH
jgi:hypothetical protein